MRLHVHEWGDPAAPPLVCLHGITAHGGRFRKLAEERLARRFRVLAPDLRGHGHSSWEPPWSIAAHLDDLVETVTAAGVERADWLGHSFGGRLLMELVGRAPERIARAVLLDPAIQVLPHVALDMAEGERADASFETAEEAVEARLASPRLLHTPREIVEEEMRVHLERGADGRLRHRYCRGAVIAAWSEMCTAPSAYGRLCVPTLLVVGAQSYLIRDEQVAGYRAGLGELLEVRSVPGGHTVLWDAFSETADVVEEYLAPLPPGNCGRQVVLKPAGK